MNRKQKTCLLIGIALVVVMGLYLPWTVEIRMVEFGHLRTFVQHGYYAWIGNPPYSATYDQPYDYYDMFAEPQVRVIGISWVLLVIQFSVVAWFTFSTWFYTSDQEWNEPIL